MSLIYQRDKSLIYLIQFYAFISLLILAWWSHMASDLLVNIDSGYGLPPTFVASMNLGNRCRMMTSSPISAALHKDKEIFLDLINNQNKTIYVSQKQ